MDDLIGFIADTMSDLMDPLLRRLVSAIRWRRHQGPHDVQESR